jgi:uncharacterized protein YaaN involved in tellurite resistance
VATNGDLSLTPPQPVKSISDAEAQRMVQLNPAITASIESVVQRFVTSITSLDPKSAEFGAKLKAIQAMGDQEMRDSAGISNRFLERPARAVESGPLSKTAAVSKSLVELRRTVEDLDPSRQNLLGRRRILGLIPFGNRLRDYFARYQSAQRHLTAIINSLYRGQDELRKDNATIEQEKISAWSIKERLEQYVYMANKLDDALSAHIDAIAQNDPDRAKQLREDLLFYVRQKRQDLVTQLAVNAQGYLALDLVRKSNAELIKGVDRATTTTVSALRTAVMVSQALTNQKLVLDQTAAVNRTTGEIIEATSQVLREQTELVHQQAAGAAVSIESLRHAFANVYAAIDSIDRYKLQALDSMQKTVEALSDEVGRAQDYLQRATAPAPQRLEGQRGDDELLLKN